MIQHVLLVWQSMGMSQFPKWQKFFLFWRHIPSCYPPLVTADPHFVVCAIFTYYCNHYYSELVVVLFIITALRLVQLIILISTEVYDTVNVIGTIQLRKIILKKLIRKKGIAVATTASSLLLLLLLLILLLYCYCLPTC